jgi:hypothetical protein
MVHRVRLGCLALSSGTGVGWVFTHREAHALRALAPVQVVRAFLVAFLLAVDDSYVRLDAAIRGKDNAAMRSSDFR